MLQWNELHAYNAVHVVKVPAPLDMGRLADSLRGTLESHGLTGLSIDPSLNTYQYQGGPAEEQIVTVNPDQDTQVALAHEIQRQLNTAFVPGMRFRPFRFFVMTMESTFHFGVSYFHMIAGAESIVLLMQDIVNTFLGRNERGLSSPVDIYPATYGSWLRRHPGVLVRKVASLPSFLWKLSRSWRPRYRDEMHTGNGFELFCLNAEQLTQLKSISRSWGITINDLFLSLYLKTLEPLENHRALSSRRNRISIGTIVNIRKDMAIDSRRTFGLFLGSFVVTHKVPKGIGLKVLAADVCRQTQHIKKTRRYMGSPVDLASALRTLSILSMERKKKFYQKHYPLWGGLTNMNLNTIWPQDGEAKTVDYIRAVSTGPATPLVLSITTVRDIINIGISYRTTVYTPADIDYIKSEIVNLISRLEVHT